MKENQKATSHGAAKLRPGKAEDDDPVKLSRPEAPTISLDVCPHNHTHLLTLLQLNEEFTILTALAESEDIPVHLRLNLFGLL